MVGDPGLSPLALPSDPIAHQQAIVGVAIPLYFLDVHVLASGALPGGRIGRYSFGPQIKLGCAGKMREVKTGTKGCMSRRRDGEDVIMDFRVVIKSQPFSQIR